MQVSTLHTPYPLPTHTLPTLFPYQLPIHTHLLPKPYTYPNYFLLRPYTLHTNNLPIPYCTNKILWYPMRSHMVTSHSTPKSEINVFTQATLGFAISSLFSAKSSPGNCTIGVSMNMDRKINCSSHKWMWICINSRQWLTT